VHGEHTVTSMIADRKIDFCIRWNHSDTNCWSHLLESLVGLLESLENASNLLAAATQWAIHRLPHSTRDASLRPPCTPLSAACRTTPCLPHQQEDLPHQHACRTSGMTAARVVHMGRQSEPARGSKGPRGGAAAHQMSRGAEPGEEQRGRARRGAEEALSTQIAKQLRLVCPDGASARVPADTQDCQRIHKTAGNLFVSSGKRLLQQDCKLQIAGSAVRAQAGSACS
jgi:hypothetical protein